MFYEWREVLKTASKQKEMIGGQMVHHNRRVKQGCMKEWKKFTLKSRAEKHRNQAVTSKVRISFMRSCFLLLFISFSLSCCLPGEFCCAKTHRFKTLNSRVFSSDSTLRDARFHMCFLKKLFPPFDL